VRSDPLLGRARSGSSAELAVGSGGVEVLFSSVFLPLFAASCDGRGGWSQGAAVGRRARWEWRGHRVGERAAGRSVGRGCGARRERRRRGVAKVRPRLVRRCRGLARSARGCSTVAFEVSVPVRRGQLAGASSPGPGTRARTRSGHGRAALGRLRSPCRTGVGAMPRGRSPGSWRTAPRCRMRPSAASGARGRLTLVRARRAPARRRAGFRTTARCLDCSCGCSRR